MGRRQKLVPITDAGRDKGKLFVVHEMDASQGEWWAIRAILALTRAGVEIPENLQGQGWAGLAILGFRGLLGIKDEDVKPLLDEMWDSCVAYIPDPKDQKIYRGAGPMSVGALVESDVEEVMTRVQLRSEAFTLHTGFSLADLKSKDSTSSTTTSADSPAV